jgi:hypothetical protein
VHGDLGADQHRACSINGAGVSRHNGRRNVG